MKILIVEDERKTNDYDLVVLDAMLPGLDGWQVMRGPSNQTPERTRACSPRSGCKRLQIPCAHPALRAAQDVRI